MTELVDVLGFSLGETSVQQLPLESTRLYDQRSPLVILRRADALLAERDPNEEWNPMDMFVTLCRASGDSVALERTFRYLRAAHRWSGRSRYAESLSDARTTITIAVSYALHLQTGSPLPSRP